MNKGKAVAKPVPVLAYPIKSLIQAYCRNISFERAVSTIVLYLSEFINGINVLLILSTSWGGISDIQGAISLVRAW